MKIRCENITRQVIPALRSAIAQQLANKGMPEAQIAKSLGVAQPAVSKYIHNKQSKDVTGIKNAIIRSRVEQRIVSMIIQGASAYAVNKEFEKVSAACYRRFSAV